MRRLKLALLASGGLLAVAASGASAAAVDAAMPAAAHVQNSAVQEVRYYHAPPGYRWYWGRRWYRHRVWRHRRWYYY